MTIKTSTGLRNAMLGTGSLKSIMDAGSEIRIYSGAVPADADASIAAAVLLLTIKNGSSGITFDTAAAAGVLLKKPSETWGGTVVADGVPTFYRHVLTADTGTASTTAPRYQGSCGVAGADMNFTAGALVTGAVQTMPFHSVNLPAS